MVKINHNRPSLRYLDNFRRELKRENRPAPTWFEPKKASVLGLSESTSEEFSEHVIAFVKLPEKQQAIIDYAFETYGAYLEALSGVISYVMKGSSKQRKRARLAKDEAEEAFIVAGAVLVASFVDDISNKRDGFLQWFEGFYNDLDRQSQLAWADFAEKLFHDCTALFLAQQMSDDPDRVDEMREYLLADDDD